MREGFPGTGAGRRGYDREHRRVARRREDSFGRAHNLPVRKREREREPARSCVQRPFAIFSRDFRTHVLFFFPPPTVYGASLRRVGIYDV